MILWRILILTLVLNGATACSENSGYPSSSLDQSSWQRSWDFGNGQIETTTWHFYSNNSFVWEIRSDTFIQTKGRWISQSGDFGVSALFLYVENNSESVLPRHIFSYSRDGSSLILGEQEFRTIKPEANSIPDISTLTLPAGTLVDHFPLWELLTSNIWLIVKRDSAIDPDRWHFKKNNQYTMLSIAGCELNGTWSLLDITPNNAKLRVTFPTQCTSNTSASIIVREIPIQKVGIQLFFYNSVYSPQ